ncbi:hypothetical protein VNO78_15724 [Psophocarpus tetragonolobus]|uniref:Uncharacterized protein n=1 Tax=Psophocarpus tetragonolobus TaxID=3891 RepID=A0AAN9SKT6_PSOTE
MGGLTNHPLTPSIPSMKEALTKPHVQVQHPFFTILFSCDILCDFHKPRRVATNEEEKGLELASGGVKFANVVLSGEGTELGSVVLGARDFQPYAVT